MKKREDLDAIRYLHDVLHEPHDGPVPTFARGWHKEDPKPPAEKEDAAKPWLSRFLVFVNKTQT